MRFKKFAVAALASASCGGLFALDASAAKIVAHSEDGFAGDAFTYIETDDFSVGLNDSGDFVFMGVRQGGEDENYDSFEALYRGNVNSPAAQQRLVRQGDVVDRKLITNIDHDGVRLNAAGDYTFSANIGYQAIYNDALFKSDRSVLLPDDTIDGYGIERMDEEGNDIDDSGRVAHHAKLISSNPGEDDHSGPDAIFFDGKKIAIEGELLAGETLVRLPQNNELRVNNSGQLAYTGVTKDAVRDENWDVIAPAEYALFKSTVTGDTVTHAVVAKTGDGFGPYGNLRTIREDYLDQNNLGHIAFGASVDVQTPRGYDAAVILVDEGDGPEVRFANGQTMADGRVLYEVDSSSGVLINDVGDIVFMASYVDGSEYGRRALFNQNGVLLVSTAYDNEGNITEFGTQFGEYYVNSISGEAWALNNLGQVLVGVGLVDAAGNYSSALVLVPEPATAALLVVGCVALVRKSGRRGR